MHVVEYYSCFFTFYISISLPILSDPTKKDSDGDGINDFSDPQLMIKNELGNLNWNVWSGINIEEYMRKRNITEIVFKGVQQVLVTDNYHTSVIIIASPESSYYDNKHFTQSGDDYSENWSNIKYVTLGVGQSWLLFGDPLTCDYNRDRDVMLDIKVHMINLTTSPEVNLFIDDLLKYHEYFYELEKDSKPSYDLFPENENEQNSNSYAVGLLRVSHIDDLGTPPYEVPGYEYPLAKKYFGVGDE